MCGFYSKGLEISYIVMYIQVVWDILSPKMTLQQGNIILKIRSISKAILFVLHLTGMC